MKKVQPLMYSKFCVLQTLPGAKCILNISEMLSAIIQIYNVIRKMFCFL